jgi:TRAP-type C4-dicarboxylate transport system substrate-binding protein
MRGFLIDKSGCLAYCTPKSHERRIFAMYRKLLILCLLLFWFCLSSPVAFGQTQSANLSFATFFPAPHKLTLILTEWCKEIEKRTEAKVKITMFPGSTLTPGDKCYDGVVNGISDLGMADLAYTRGRFPLCEVFYLPLGYKSAAVATGLMNEFYSKFRPKELDDTKLLFLHGHGPGLIHTKKPVQKLEDLKGVKIRSTGMTTKIVGALGAIPVAMTMSEAYDSLQKGIVEGIICPVEALEGWKLGEVVKSTTESYICAYSSAFFVTMNKGKWNALSPEIQKTIEKISGEWMAKAGVAWDEIDKTGRDFTLKRGNQIVPLSKEEEQKWTSAVKPLYDEYLNSMKAKNLPGEEALKFCPEYLKQNQK